MKSNKQPLKQWEMRRNRNKRKFLKEKDFQKWENKWKETEEEKTSTQPEIQYLSSNKEALFGQNVSITGSGRWGGGNAFPKSTKPQTRKKVGCSIHLIPLFSRSWKDQSFPLHGRWKYQTQIAGAMWTREAALVPTSGDDLDWRWTGQEGKRLAKGRCWSIEALRCRWTASMQLPQGNRRSQEVPGWQAFHDFPGATSGHDHTATNQEEWAW